MQLSEIRSRVLQRAGSPASEAYANNEINDALREIAATAVWPWLRSVYTFELGSPDGDFQDPYYGDGTANDPASGARLEAFAVPTDLAAVETVMFGGVDLPQVAPADAEIGQWPFGFWVDEVARSLVIVNGAGKTGPVAVNYVAAERELVDDSDEPRLPDRHVNILIDMAAARLLEGRDKKEQARADVIRRRAGTALRRMRMTVSGPRPRLPRISPGAPY